MAEQKSTIVAIPEATMRNRLTSLVESLPDFRVVACTADLMNTYNEVEVCLPKAVLISGRLAELPEFEVMRGLFSALDVRWLVVTEPDHRPGLRRPIAAGVPQGSDLFAVPAGASSQIIANQLRSLTRSDTQSSHEFSATNHGGMARSSLSGSKAPEATPCRLLDSDTILLIGSSTGGVDALISVLSTFPEDCPPTLIVQHTGAGFGLSLARLLNRQCAANVQLATGVQPLNRGLVLIGAGTASHLTLDTSRHLVARLVEGPAVSGHQPSVDVLFRSALPVAKRISAAILTGMGRDGATGLKDLKEAGAHTIAQDEASCVVFGMPRTAIEMGAATEVLPIGKIGPALLRQMPATQKARS